MKVKVEPEACIGCGLCTQISPVVFEMNDDKAIVKVEQVPSEDEDNVRESIESCPTDAIISVE
jgi:ferredoxin